MNSEGEILWEESGLPICTASELQWFQEMIKDKHNDAIITWEDRRSGSTSKIDIYAQKLGGCEVQWIRNGVSICTAPDFQFRPTITYDCQGGAIITWWDYRYDFGPSIYTQQVSAQGVLGDVDLGTKGDVNKDGNINVLDVVLCVNIVIERGDMPAPEELYRADVDHSGEINVSDVLGMVDIILNRGNQI